MSLIWQNELKLSKCNSLKQHCQEQEVVIVDEV